MIDPRTPDFSLVPGDTRRPRAFFRAASPASPAVSIVTPYYNDNAYLAQTAASVLGQSLQNFEWIIVDDCSTNPEAVAALGTLAATDSRIRIVRAERNGGPGAARNLGFRHARSDLVYQLDADDLLEPTAVEKCAWYLATHPDAAFCNGYESGFGAQEYTWPNGFHTPHLFLEACPVGAHAVMVRKSAHDRVGEYDESIRGGMEDWEFWLRAADKGVWGDTIPEYLAWYRRRENHAARWADWDGGEKQRRFHAGLREKYARLYREGMPHPVRPPSLPFDVISPEPPFSNPLVKDRPRILMVLTWFTMGGADKYNLRMTEQFARRGWDITLAGTLPGDQSWLPQFASLTPDVHVLPHYLPHNARPLYLRYLIESRDPDVVLISNSEPGYLFLPYLRAHCPRPAYVDYNHMEEPYWKNGGYPRYGAACQEQLDLNIVSSRHLRNWMVSRGACAERIEVCTTNEDPQQWKPDANRRRETREKLNIDGTTPVMLYAGRICEQKQPVVFAATLSKLHQAGLEFVALVAGDGVDLPALKEACTGGGFASKVRFLGAVPNAEMLNLSAAADIFFLPSLWEGISLAVYEAMSAGLAIVGGDVGGQRELVSPECGSLIHRSTHEQEAADYAAALTPLIADPSLARRMGEASRRRIIDHFQLSHMGDRMEALMTLARQNAAKTPRPQLPISTTHEIAERGVEYLRIHEFCDYLWVERERMRQAVGGAPTTQPPAGSLQPESAAELELAYLERSKLFGLVLAAKSTPIYRAMARFRWGANWSLTDPKEPAAQRLARIKASRSYRLIQSLKSTGIYRFYALRKYGNLGVSSVSPTHLNGVATDARRLEAAHRSRAKIPPPD